MRAAALLVALAAPVAAAPLDMLVGETPAQLRVEVTVGGEPIGKVWDEAFAKLTALYDRNGDGRLDRAEAARLPSAFSLYQISWGRSVPHTGLSIPWDELARGKDTIGPAEVAAYYRKFSLGGATVVLGKTTGGPALTAALLARLDVDGDGKVSEVEWKAAPARLAPLDTNEDELVGPAELVPRAEYPGATATALLTVASDGVVRLGTKPDEAVARWRIDMPAWPAGGAPKLATGDQPVNQLVQVSPTTRLTIRPDAGRLPGEMAAARKRLLDQFTDADTDRDSRVVAGEVTRRNLYELQQVLTLADRDGDGALTTAELGAWLDVQEAVARGHVVLTLRDHGAGLFELLDADLDGALSVRELRTAWERVRAAPHLGFDAAKLRRQIVGTVARGTPTTELTRPARPGPDWHRGMDRNGDGDVSRREFTGPPAEFDRLDRDHDGLIDATEGTRA